MNERPETRDSLWAKPDTVRAGVDVTMERETPIVPSRQEHYRRADDHNPAVGPLGDLLDLLDQGIVLLRSDLHPCFHNSAATRLLDAEPERDVLAQEVRALSRVALGPNQQASVEREVGTSSGYYRLRAQLLKQKLIHITSRTILVTIEPAAPTIPSDEFLMRRFAMTRREAAVAVLLARGASNSTVASELRISIHTARHHTESVLGKLNVHTRAEVSQAIVAGHSNGSVPGRQPRTLGADVRASS